MGNLIITIVPLRISIFIGKVFKFNTLLRKFFTTLIENIKSFLCHLQTNRLIALLLLAFEFMGTLAAYSIIRNRTLDMVIFQAKANMYIPLSEM